MSGWCELIHPVSEVLYQIKIDNAKIHEMIQRLEQRIESMEKSN